MPNEQSEIIEKRETKTIEGNKYFVKTKKRSYFMLDGGGNLVQEKYLHPGKIFFKKGEAEYNFERILISTETALIIMDPWTDSGDDNLNRHFGKVVKYKLLPLVSKAPSLGIVILILTNDPDKHHVDYGSAIHPELQVLVEQGKAKILYHQDFDYDGFADYLHKLSINTLIYSGFASNMCVIGRSMGMVPMKSKGFHLYFVPKASAAVEFKESWQSGRVHVATTSLISQWVAELIDLDEFLKIVPPKQVN